MRNNHKNHNTMQPLLAMCTDDIKTQIMSHCGTLLELSNLSQINKSFHALIMHSNSGQGLWLGIASTLTGYNAKEHIHVNSDDFHAKVKLLVCPWLAIPRPLPLRVEPFIDPDSMRLTLDRDETSAVLWLKTDYGFDIVDTSNARPDSKDSRPDVSTLSLTLPTVPSRKTFLPIKQPTELQILPNQSDYRHYYQRIHDSVSAVIEVTAWDLEQRSGIYFFSRKNGINVKILRHILIGECPAKTNMIIRPMEMWMLTEDRAIYFGPQCSPLPLTVAGRMDRALWLAGMGRVNEAIQFQQRLGVSDINAHAITGSMTLLHAATYRNKINTVKTLLKAKADPEARDDQEMSCLMIAASMEYPNMIRTLCKEGLADPNVETHYNETALHMVGNQCATEEKSIRATVKALLDFSANPNPSDIKGQTPLFCYTILDSPATVDLLCSRGANPMHRNLKGETPLHALFEMHGKRETAIILFKKYKVDVDAKDNNGMTALMHAANTHVYANVRILLNDLHANPLLCNNEGQDALSLARNENGPRRYTNAVIQMLETKCAEWRAV